MPNFKYQANPKELVQSITAIEYGDGAHKDIFLQLQNVAQNVTKNQSLHPIQQQAILLGAALFCREQIKAEYTIKPNVHGSNLFTALTTEVPLIAALLTADDRKDAQKFAFKSFSDWFSSVALANGEPRLENCYYGEYKDNELVHKNIINRLDILTGSLPPIQSSMYQSISDNELNANAAEYIEQPQASSSWGISGLLSGFWSSPAKNNDVPQEEKKTQEEETANTI